MAEVEDSVVLPEVCGILDIQGSPEDFRVEWWSINIHNFNNIHNLMILISGFCVNTLALV